MKKLTILTAASSQQVALIDVSNLFSGVPPRTCQCRFFPYSLKALLLALYCFALPAVSAAPFLVSDDYVPQSDPNLNPTHFILTGLLAMPTTFAATTRSNGNIVLQYDLANVANGKYTVTAAAENIFGGVSVESAPFTFTKGLPNTPLNLRIVPAMLQ